MVSNDTFLNKSYYQMVALSIEGGALLKFLRVRELRIDHDKTQQEIADYLHMNRQVYARYENGLREIPVSVLIQLANYYHVSLDYIVEKTE